MQSAPLFQTMSHMFIIVLTDKTTDVRYVFLYCMYVFLIAISFEITLSIFVSLAKYI